MTQKRYVFVEIFVTFYFFESFYIMLMKILKVYATVFTHEELKDAVNIASQINALTHFMPETVPSSP